MRGRTHFGRVLRPALLAAALTLLLLGRSAPDARAEPSAGWQFQVAPYLWLPTVDVTIGTTSLPALPNFNAEADAFDLLESLDFGFLGLAEARYGRYGVLADILYLGLTIDKDTPFALFSGAEAEVDSLISTTAFTFRLGERGGVSVDALAGARVYSVDVDLTFKPGLAMRRTANVSELWVDPLVGGRVKADLGGDVFGVLYGDVGGFGAGSDFSSQAYVGIGYNFSESTSAQIGYRYLGFEYEPNGVPLDMDLYGPLVGGNFRF